MSSDGPLERRLAAILMADVVGYSRLMSADEEGTFSAVTDCLSEVIEPCILAHRGRLVKTIGDGVLAEFVSVLDAVRCAVAVQDAMVERNVDIPEAKRIIYRIGVNLGDVIVQDDDIFGDGVNVAARLEGLAPPGGIVLSGSVFDQVAARVTTGFEDLGPQKVKNIAEPVRAYAARPAAEATVALDPPMPPLSLPARPSVAVLPFVNMSRDPEQDYFAEGISEDITTELSRFGAIFVVSRNSAFRYQSGVDNLDKIARELGVKYIAQGSVRKSGERVRVTVQLVETDTGTEVWAEKFDRRLEDVFEIQDEITETVVSTIAGRLQKIEITRAKKKSTENLTAYEFLLRGLDIHKSGWVNPERAQLAFDFFSRAVVLDPGFARAHAWRACAMSGTFGEHLSDEDREQCRAVAQVAYELDPDESEANRILGSIYLGAREFDKADYHIARSVALNPNDAHHLVMAGESMSYMGRAAEGKELIARAMRLNPHHPDWYWQQMGLACYVGGQFGDAIEAINRNFSPTVFDHALLAACYIELDQPDAAHGHVNEILSEEPGASIGYFRSADQFSRFKDVGILEQLLNALTTAGLPG